MKKSLLLLMLLPFIGFAQVDLVRWNGNPNTIGGPYVPTSIASNVSAENIAFTGVIPNSGQWGFFEATGWNTGTSNDTNKFIQFTIGGNLNNTVTVQQINFQYNGGVNSYRVRWSKDSNFTTYTEIATVNNANSGNNNTSGNISGLNIPITTGEKLYVRFYAFNGNNLWNNGIFRLVNDVVFRGTATAPSPLTGTYNVGAGSANTFKTITAAVSALNQVGVQGPVTFLLQDAVYNNTSGEVFPITINQFNGTSSVNTVTFKPAPSANVRIEAFRDALTGHHIPTQAVFKLNGADNIIFDGSNSVNGTTRNLMIVNSSYVGGQPGGPHDPGNDTANRSVLWLASASGSNGSNNVTVKYTNIRQSYRNKDSNYCMGLYSGDTEMAQNGALAVSATANSNLNVIGNDFMNVKQGIYINGRSQSPSANIYIYQNDLGSENNTETIIQPAFLSNVHNFTYSENLVYNLYRNSTGGDLDCAGLIVSGNSQDGIVTKNNMRDLTRTVTNNKLFAGIILNTNNNNSNILVANNFILNVTGLGNSETAYNGFGINIASGGGYKIYHNTILLKTNQAYTERNFSAAVFIEANTKNLDIRNNIFANEQTAPLTEKFAIIIKSQGTTFTALDYNNYYSSQYIGHYGVQPNNGNNNNYYSTMSGWLNAVGNNRDQHSLNVSPVFASATDLHLGTGNSALNDAGTAIAAVTKDIDGQMRSTTHPDMGADEFGSVEMPEPGTGTGIFCEASTTWNGTSWSHGDPTSETDVIFAADYTLQDGSTLLACSMWIEDGADVIFANESNAEVTHSVNVADGGTLTFENNCHLLQLENTQNTGNALITRNSSKLKRLDYTIWSSPVAGSQTLQEFSPLTLSNRFYTYSTQANTYMPIADPASTTFTKAAGYLIRVPNNFPVNVPTIYTGEFEGVPNNGVVRIPLVYSPDYKNYNMVGNPYPSPINVGDFIDANIDNIEGTLWVWRKTNDPSQTSYSIITKFAYCANNAPGGGGNNGNGGNNLIGNPFNNNPKGMLNTGQGFIVKAKSSQDLVFRNNMRVENHSNHFFRMSNNEEDTDTQGLSASRIWFNVTNSEDAFTQTVVGYTAQATTGYDNGFDGKVLGSGSTSLFSILEDETELAIQARPDFVVTDVVKMGFKTEIAGDFEFAIDSLDGVFTGSQKIFLKDNLTGTKHNLKNGAYTFNAEIGTFYDRFEIVYTDTTNNTDDVQLGTVEFDTKNVIVYRNGKQINATAPATIRSIEVYDILGRDLYTNSNINTTEFSSPPLNTSQQVVVVKLTLDNQKVVIKKIMMD